MITSQEIVLIQEHLEFLGYQTKRSGEFQAIATCSGKPDIVVICTEVGTMLSSKFKSDPSISKYRIGFLEAINQANMHTSFSKYCVTDDDALMIWMWYLGEYNRVSFGKLIDLWNMDMAILFQKLELSKYIA